MDSCRLKGGNHPVGHWDEFENLAAGLADWLLAKHCEELQQQPKAARPSSTYADGSGATPEPCAASSYSFPPGELRVKLQHAWACFPGL